jgi:hypothetical protein
MTFEDKELSQPKVIQQMCQLKTRKKRLIAYSLNSLWQHEDDPRHAVQLQ